MYKMSDYCDIEKVREPVDISVVDLRRFRESSVFPAGTELGGQLYKKVIKFNYD